MKKKFVYTLTLLSLLFVSQAYAFDWLNKLESKFIKKEKTYNPKDKTAKLDVRLEGYDVSKFNKKELMKVRKALIQFYIERDNTQFETPKTSSVDHDNFQLLEDFFMSTANANSGQDLCALNNPPKGTPCMYGGYRSIYFCSRCSSPTNTGARAYINTMTAEQKQEVGMGDYYHESLLDNFGRRQAVDGSDDQFTYGDGSFKTANDACGANKVSCSSGLFGSGICVAREPLNTMTTRCNDVAQERYTSSGGTEGIGDFSNTEDYNRRVDEVRTLCNRGGEEATAYDGCDGLRRRLVSARADAVARQAGERLTAVNSSLTTANAEVTRLEGLAEDDRPENYDTLLSDAKANVTSLTETKENLTGLQTRATTLRDDPNSDAVLSGTLTQTDDSFKAADTSLARSAELTEQLNRANITADDALGLEGDDRTARNGLINGVSQVAANEEAVTCGKDGVDQPGTCLAGKQCKQAEADGPFTCVANAEGNVSDADRVAEAGRQTGEQLNPEVKPTEPADPHAFTCQGNGSNLPSITDIIGDGTEANPGNRQLFKPSFLEEWGGNLDSVPAEGEIQEKYAGTEPFIKCQRLSHVDWKTIASGNFDPATGGNFAWAWANELRKVKQEMQTVAAEYAAAKTEAKQKMRRLSNANPQTEQTAIGNLVDDVKDKVALMRRKAQEMQSIYNRATDTASNLRDKISKCVAASYTMTGMDFDDSELTTPGESQSMDGTINCVTQGGETQDYSACQSGITAYNAAMIAHQGLEIYEQVDFADFQMEQELEFQKNNAEGANGDFTFALKSQKAAIEKHAKQLEARAVFDAVKMGVFFGFMQGMPTKQDKVNECVQGSDCQMQFITHQYNEFNLAFFQTLYETFEQNSGGDNDLISYTTVEEGAAPGEFTIIEKDAQGQPLKMLAFEEAETSCDALTQAASEVRNAQSGYNSGTQAMDLSGASSSGGPVVFVQLKASCNASAPNDLDRMCQEAVNGDPGMAIIENSEAREAMKGALMQATADLATHLLQKNILDKQAQRIQDAINGIQNFEPIPLTFTGEDLLGTLCAPDAFPSHPECLNLDTSKIYGFPDQNFNINGADAATTGQGLLGDNVEDNNSSDAVGNNNPDNRIANRNRTVARNRAGGNGGLRAGGGSGKLGGGSALGSASGGSSAPGGGTPSGGGSKGAGGKQAAQGKKRKIGGYNGSSAGTLAFGRGAGGGRAKKKAKNPFANFKKKNNQNGVLSFRNPAGIGSKSSNIFNMISSGYSRAVKGNKLLKYEAVKK